MVDLSHFYLLQDPLDERYARCALGIGTADAFAVTRGVIVPQEPVEARVVSGRILTHVVWTTSAVPLLVRDDVLSAFHGAALRGWSTYAVKLHRKAGMPVSGYAGLAVTGRCGPIDDAASLPVVKRYPASTGYVRRGLAFAPESWDGSDFFMPATQTSGLVIVSERAMRLIDALRVENLNLEPLSEVERPVLRPSAH